MGAKERVDINTGGTDGNYVNMSGSTLREDSREHVRHYSLYGKAPTAWTEPRQSAHCIVYVDNVMNTTYDLGSCSEGPPFLWNTPSTNTPFLPLQVMKKAGWSKNTSRCFLEMKLEWPILTSTSPLLLLRPMVICFWRTRYSKSRPSRRAIAVPVTSGAHCTFEGLAGADLSARRAQASLSAVLEYWDITSRSGVTLRDTALCLPTAKTWVAKH